MTTKSGVVDSVPETVFTNALCAASEAKAVEDTLVSTCCTVKNASWATVGPGVGVMVGALGRPVGVREGIAVGDNGASVGTDVSI